MVFSTPLFLFVYLSLTLLLYYAVPLKGRNLALLAVSLFFYAWGERIYVVIMVASTLIDYTHGMLVERCKARGNDRGARWAVASSVFFNLALLGFFKYWDFLAASFQAVGLNFMPVLNVHLPIGISFYTFQTMSYTILVDYFCSRGIESHRDNPKLCRVFLILSVVFNLGMLGFFKYTNFFVENLNALFGLSLRGISLRLPLGISFYTFQTMSYTIDVYRGDARAQRSLVNFGTFVTLFPQLIAGPIIKYKDLGDQIDSRTCTVEKFASGVQMFVIGLGKKVLIANNVGMLWESYKAMAPGDLTVAGAWLGVLAFAIQIYFDFSGYSDMAVGLGRMLGFEFMRNFNYPYISRSITEFWRRWHISLSTWFREYLYIPLGGNRCSKGRWVLNLFLVWAATGIWHGASWNFVLWGLYFWVLLLVEKFVLLRWLKRAPGAVGHLYTLFFVLVSWTIFAIEDFGQLGEYLKVMFGLGGVPLIDGAFKYYAANYLPVLCISALAATPLGAAVYRRLNVRTAHILGAVLILAGLLLCTAYLVDGTYNPFLYFRF